MPTKCPASSSWTRLYLCDIASGFQTQQLCICDIRQRLGPCDQVEELVLSELEKLKKSGFTSTAVEAALNSIEFDLRENNTGSFPRGLSLMLRSMSTWIYDKDPFQPLQWTDALEHFKVRSLLPQLWPLAPFIHSFILSSFTHRSCIHPFNTILVHYYSLMHSLFMHLLSTMLYRVRCKGPHVD